MVTGPHPDLLKLRVHHLRGLVELTLVNQSLAATDGLVRGARLRLHHLQWLHSWEGGVGRLQGRASCQDHRAGLG